MYFDDRNLNGLCPDCGGNVIRIQRRWQDRLLSLFKAIRRGRCEQFGCGWEGRLGRSDQPYEKKQPRFFDSADDTIGVQETSRGSE
jgi:hypothetical protein